MNTTTPRQTVTDLMHTRTARMRRRQLEAALATEDAAWADYRSNLVGATYVAAEMARPGRDRTGDLHPDELTQFVTLLARSQELIDAEDARHDAARAGILKRIAGLTDEPVDGAA